MIVRIYTGPDGNSHFQDLEQPPDTDAATPRKASVSFRLRPPGFFQDWHKPATPTYVITLTGQAEVQAEDGATRRFGPGDILFAEDTRGKGHTSRCLGSAPRLIVTIALDGGTA